MADKPVMYLQGDEDCGVSLHCRICWTGGLPFAYYPGNYESPYPRDRVPVAEDIETLAELARKHAESHEGITDAATGPA